MFPAIAQLCVPALILVILFVVLAIDGPINDLAAIAPIVVIAGILWCFGAFIFVGVEHGFIKNPPEYTCPDGKVKLYNYRNVYCIDGELATEVK